MSNVLKTAVVGCRGMGANHARNAQATGQFEIVATCDLDLNLAQELAANFEGAKAYSEYSQMLRECEPDVVIVATATAPHAALTIQAVESGARGVFCEKPMAVNLGEARRMLEVCQKNNVALMVNHQRRMHPVFQTMRRVMESGAIGKVQLIRASCAGDILSDGTHLIDTVRHLNGDCEVKWVFGQITRQLDIADATGKSGFRYGHPVESGGMAILQFENGVRVELFTGSMQQKGRMYQDYEVWGIEGRLHRAGDSAEPPLLIQNGQSNGWKPVPIEGFNDPKAAHAQLSQANLRGFYAMIHEGKTHPMSGDSAFKDQEIVMAIYESSRLRQRIDLPLHQEAFPLALMIEAGEL